MKAIVRTDAGSVEFAFSAFVLDPNDVMGLCQVSLSVQRKPPAPPKVFDNDLGHLRLRVSGFSELFTPVADCCVTPEKAEAVFSSEEPAGTSLPTEIEVLWCKDSEQSLGLLVCSPRPAEKVTATEALRAEAPHDIRESERPKKPWWQFW